MKIVLTAAVAVAGLWFAVSGSREDPHYFMLDKLVASGLGKHEAEVVRVHGFVVAGTIQQNSHAPEIHEFMLTWGGVALRVRMHGPLPDTFRDQSEVIVRGTVVHDDHWRIDADELLTKCSVKYDGGGRPLGDSTKFK